jgi:hypothetical protein
MHNPLSIVTTAPPTVLSERTRSGLPAPLCTAAQFRCQAATEVERAGTSRHFRSLTIAVVTVLACAQDEQRPLGADSDGPLPS